MKKKKFSSIGIVLCMLFALVALPASASQSGTCGEYLTWALDDNGTLTISGTGDMNYTGEAPWYNSRSSIKTVVIESGVKNIGFKAFYGCGSITQIEIPDSVTTIGNFAFYGCSRLTHISIPNNVTSIGAWAFQYCYGLTSIKIPDGVKRIGMLAFANCTSLAQIELPDSILSIEDSAFLNTAYYKNNYNWEDGVLYINNILIIANDTVTSVTVKSGTKYIADNAFAYCRSLTQIEIPNSVTGIGLYAFQYCSSLKHTVILGTVANLSMNTFMATPYDLDKYGWEDDALYISDHLIRVKNTGTDFSVKPGTKAIGNDAFRYCTELTSIEIPRSVTIIGLAAWRDGIKDIYYHGSKQDWENISIGLGYSRTTIHYNSAPYGDLNGDGRVTAKDNTILVRYLAHWIGYESLPHLQ